MTRSLAPQNYNSENIMEFVPIRKRNARLPALLFEWRTFVLGLYDVMFAKQTEQEAAHLNEFSSFRFWYIFKWAKMLHGNMVLLQYDSD